MNKLTKKIIYLLSISFVLFATACDDDIAPEITEIDSSRLFSPTKLEAVISNQTSVRIKWDEVKKADSYNLRIFEGENTEGTPVREIKDLKMLHLPYTVSGLEGETDYLLSVQAVASGYEDSKWTNLAFTTGKEQIFYPVDLNEVEATQVTLRWPAGETATTIVLTPGDITYTVTQSDIAAGMAKITGLTPETAYTASLMNGKKTRGTATFTTTLDIGNATLVKPEDNLAELIAGADKDQVFALMPGDYVVDANIAITVPVSIKGARPAEKPVIKGAVFRMKEGSGIELRDLTLDATGSDGNQMIVYDDDSANEYEAATIENCTISNYVKGIFYVNKKALIKSVSFNGNYIYDVECNGGDFIDFRSGIARTFTFKNNTVNNCAWARDFFRMDSGGANNFTSVTSAITISNNTLNNVSNGSNRRILYIRLGEQGQITFTHNVISNTEGYYTNQSTTNIVKMEKNNYFNASGFYSSAVEKAYNDALGNYTSLDPGYKDGFTITNEDLIRENIGNIK